jgi:hypothetical protein
MMRARRRSTQHRDTSARAPSRASQRAGLSCPTRARISCRAARDLLRRCHLRNSVQSMEEKWSVALACTRLEGRRRGAECRGVGLSPTGAEERRSELISATHTHTLE